VKPLRLSAQIDVALWRARCLAGESSVSARHHGGDGILDRNALPVLTAFSLLPYLDQGGMRWRKLHNEELRDLYSSPCVIRIKKSRRMSWAGHVVRMGGEEERL
jgi:hypothetical protein